MVKLDKSVELNKDIALTRFPIKIGVNILRNAAKVVVDII